MTQITQHEIQSRQSSSQIRRADLNQQRSSFVLHQKKIKSQKMKKIILLSFGIFLSIALLAGLSLFVFSAIMQNNSLSEKNRALEVGRQMLQQKLKEQKTICRAGIAHRSQQDDRAIYPPAQYKSQFTIYMPTTQQLSKLKMKKDLIIVTHAGRKSYLQILYKHLSKQVDSFYQWHLWLDTKNSTDISYIQDLAEQNSWIKIIRLESGRKINSVSKVYFYKQDCIKDKLYLKLDDDIVWMEPDFIKKMFDHREKLAQNLLVFSNIINSPIHAHIQQRLGILKYPQFIQNNCNGNGWTEPQVGAQFHKQFLQSLQKNDISKWKSFQQWLIPDYQRVPINSILYYSQTIRSLYFIESADDQFVFTQIQTRLNKKPIILVGDAVCVRWAFETQKKYFEWKHPELLPKYKRLANNL